METEFLSPVDLQSSSLPGPLQERIQHLPHTFTPEAWKSLFTPYFLAFIFLSLWLKPRPIPPLSSIWSKQTASFTISQFYTTISTVSAFVITVPASGFSCLSTFSEDTLAAVSHKGPHGYHGWPLTSQECMSFVDVDLQHLALSFFLYSTHSGPPSNFCSCSILVPFSFPRMCSSPSPVFYQCHFLSTWVLDLPLWSPPWALLPNTAPKASQAISPLLLWSSKSPTGWLSPPDGMGIDYCQYQRPLS